MKLANGPARIVAVAALMALLIGPMLFSASSALAQGAPAILYGTGLAEGDTVSASVGDVECASVAANADGEWSMQIESTAPCGPTVGDTISFALNGETAEQTATYRQGVVEVDDLAAGIVLTIAAMDDGMEDPDDGMEDPDGGMDSMTPGDKGDTGNAGLVTQSGTSALAVLALGVLALAGVAGARTVTGRID